MTDPKIPDELWMLAYPDGSLAWAHDSRDGNASLVYESEVEARAAAPEHGTFVPMPAPVCVRSPALLSVARALLSLESGPFASVNFKSKEWAAFREAVVGLSEPADDPPRATIKAGPHRCSCGYHPMIGTAPGSRCPMCGGSR
jgi:hypothetical protein